MIKLLTIIGARPQIIKAAAISRAISQEFSEKIQEIIVHTGQHYDYNMSDIFINELGIPQPNYNLNSGSGKHGQQTAMMIQGIENLLELEKPDWCILFGDTNSTLAGAVAAAKIYIPVVHIEAGLRSFDKTMPEELNRICCDHFSTLLFAPTITAIKNLQNEGFNTELKQPYSLNNPGVFHSGDIMYDNTLFFQKIAETNSTILEQTKLIDKEFLLCTIHRSHNTDNTERLLSIMQTLFDISEDYSLPILLPLHPRTRNIMKTKFTSLQYSTFTNSRYFQIIEPVSFLDITLLESKAKLIITDSGGVQKEAYFFKKPCVILRDTTEWVEIIEQQAGILTDADPLQIRNSISHFLGKPNIQYPSIFGNGKAANFICQTLTDQT